MCPCIWCMLGHMICIQCMECIIPFDLSITCHALQPCRTFKLSCMRISCEKYDDESISFKEITWRCKVQTLLYALGWFSHLQVFVPFYDSYFIPIYNMLVYTCDHHPFHMCAHCTFSILSVPRDFSHCCRKSSRQRKLNKWSMWCSSWRFLRMCSQ